MAMAAAETRKRPTRACTAKTPSRLAPLAPAVQKRSPKRSDHPVLVFPQPIPVVPEQTDRYEMRRKWELASIINFFNTFRPILKIAEFSAEELETALLTCNDLLMSIHISLLKAIYPPSRIPLNRGTWIAILSKKLKDRWSKVAAPPFPLADSQGNETETYFGFDPPTRLIILRALCEVRLDQDDVRAHMEEPVKKGYVSLFRKDRAGSNLIGTTYWCENNPVSGYRLYRDIPPPKGKEFRGRTASPPPPGQWETLATNFSEFQSVADTLTSSKFKQEIGLGKRLKQEVLPVLEAVEKKKFRDLKRKQRQAKLLVTTLENIEGGRTKRDRKPVNYTFPEYDRSINEAIKSTRKSDRAEAGNGHSALANGNVIHPENAKRSSLRKDRAANGERSILAACDAREEPDDDRDLSAGPAAPTVYQAGSSYSKQIRPRNRQRRISQRYHGNEYANPADNTDEDEFLSDDEIEGEAIYDEDFVRRRELKRKRGYASSVDDEEYRADDDVEEDDVAVSYSDEDEDLEQDDEEESKQDVLVRSMRRARKPKPPVSTGLRRSDRATRSKVNYRAYEESEVEEDEDYQSKTPSRRSRRNGEVRSMPRSIDEAEYSMDSDRSPRSSSGGGGAAREQEQEQDLGESGDEDGDGIREANVGEEYSQDAWDHVNGGEDDAQYDEDGDEDRDDRGKQLRFFDLNECAPADSPRDWMRSGFQDEREAEAG